jgi:hypothetical protein
MLICILCVAFVIESLELHQGNDSIGIQIGGYPVHMFTALHCKLWQTDAFMSHMLAVADAMCRLKRKC